MLCGWLRDGGSILRRIRLDIAEQFVHSRRTLKNDAEVIEELPARRLVLSEFIRGDLVQR